jgi:hypothetical protein
MKEKNQNVSRSIVFISSWTLLWPVIIVVFTLSIAIFVGENLTLKNVPAGLLKVSMPAFIGSMISYYFADHWLSYVKNKHLRLSFFWSAFWSIYFMISFILNASTMNGLALFTLLIPIILATFFIGLITIGIAYYASFLPPLCPKSDRDRL